MSDHASRSRHSGPLIGDPAARAAVEARNALLQFDEVRNLVAARTNNFSISPGDICGLQAIAVQDVFACAGTFRQSSISISNTPHQPPPHEDVPHLVAEMCDYANSVASDAFQSSAFLMWRLNWIHPFADGNGRTSRAVSYLALCCGLGMELPGTVTVPDLIVRNRQPYYEALDSADAACSSGGEIDVSKMKELIRTLLAEQLSNAV